MNNNYYKKYIKYKNKYLKLQKIENKINNTSQTGGVLNPFSIITNFTHEMSQPGKLYGVNEEKFTVTTKEEPQGMYLLFITGRDYKGVDTNFNRFIELDPNTEISAINDTFLYTEQNISKYLNTSSLKKIIDSDNVGLRLILNLNTKDIKDTKIFYPVATYKKPSEQTVIKKNLDKYNMFYPHNFVLGIKPLDETPPNSDTSKLTNYKKILTVTKDTESFQKRINKITRIVNNPLNKNLINCNYVFDINSIYNKSLQFFNFSNYNKDASLDTTIPDHINSLLSLAYTNYFYNICSYINGYICDNNIYTLYKKILNSVPKSDMTDPNYLNTLPQKIKKFMESIQLDDNDNNRNTNIYNYLQKIISISNNIKDYEDIKDTRQKYINEKLDILKNITSVYNNSTSKIDAVKNSVKNSAKNSVKALGNAISKRFAKTDNANTTSNTPDNIDDTQNNLNINQQKEAAEKAVKEFKYPKFNLLDNTILYNTNYDEPIPLFDIMICIESGKISSCPIALYKIKKSTYDNKTITNKFYDTIDKFINFDKGDNIDAYNNILKQKIKVRELFEKQLADAGGSIEKYNEIYKKQNEEINKLNELLVITQPAATNGDQSASPNESENSTSDSQLEGNSEGNSVGNGLVEAEYKNSS